MPRISGSSAATPEAHGRQGPWPVALTLVLLLIAGAAWLIWIAAPVLAAVLGVAGLVALGLLWSLYRRHRGAVAELVQLGETGRRRESEYQAREAEHRRQEAEFKSREAEFKSRETEFRSREAEWHRQSDAFRALVAEELTFLTGKWLPAVLAEDEVPEAPHVRERLGDDVVDAVDRLTTAVSSALEDREESQRLALVELTNRVQTSAHRIQSTVAKLATVRSDDPDLVEAAMQADHAATQQARYAQSIRVLCGEWPGQQWQKAMALVDVVRAASGRIVAYRRVEVSGDPDVGVVPSVLEQLIHLVAELLANATEYSPPRTNVTVTVRTVQRGAVVEIDDGGLGLDEYRMEQAREIVSGKRLLGIGELGEIPQTGLPVVGRFARRHGFNVDLGPSPYGGVRAVVLIPTEHLETLEPAGTRAPLTRKPATGPSSGEGTASPAGRTQDPQTRGPHPAPTPYEEQRRATSVRRLPQRRSHRGEFDESQRSTGPTGQTPPTTPDEAGNWMGRFLESRDRRPSSSPTAADDTPQEGPETA